MERSLSFFGDGSWPADEGWPYADASEEDGPDQPDLEADVDDDIVAIHATGAHLFDGLGELERAVLTARFGLDGSQPRTMREIQRETGLPRAALRTALGDGLTKVRTHLSADQP